MTPRTDIVSLPLGTPADEVRPRLRKARFARIPVTEGPDVDSVIGCVNVKEVLMGTEADLRTYVRPVYFAPEAMVAGNLFERLQNEAIQIAIIVDEYGQVAGLVSVHDLIEEVIGENPDEYTPDTPWVARRAGDGWILNGTVSIKAVNEHLGLDLPADRGQTLGGFIFHHAGHLPARGETLEWGEWEFTVQVVRRRRIAVVKLRRREEAC